MQKYELEKCIFKDDYIDIAIKRYMRFRDSETYDERYKWDILGELTSYLNNLILI